MAHQLLYTSAEKGLRPGTRGFCTVAYTKGLAPAHIQLLEALSGYKGLQGTDSDSTSPVAFCHYQSNLLGRDFSILSRLAAIPPDHTGRSNKLAHHYLIHKRERPANGPAWLSLQPEFFQTSWTPPPRLLDQTALPPATYAPPSPAHAWGELTGDCGLASLPAREFLENPAQPLYLVFRPGLEMLPLLAESLALLPPDKRWEVTYNTFFTQLPAGTLCAWRCVTPDAEILREARRTGRGKILDLTAGQLPAPPDDALTDAARHGLPKSPAPREDTKPPSPPKFRLLPPRPVNTLNLKPR